MLEADKKMIVAHIVDKVFVPDLMVALLSFGQQVQKQAIEQHEWEKEFGFSPAMPPISLDIRAAQDRLSSAIVIATRETPLQ